MKFNDKKRVELLKHDGKIYLRGFELYIHHEKGKSAPLRVTVTNIPAMYLNISDNALKSANEIYQNSLEPFIAYDEKGNHFEYRIENGENFIFDYLENLFISIIFTYAAVESIVNNLIPNNYVEKKISNSEETEIGKTWIEKNVSLTEKIKVFLPEIHSIRINTGKLKFWNNFKKLEFFRNELIHFKSEEFIDNTLKTGPLIGELFVEVKKFGIIDSGREIIKMLVNKIPTIQGVPHEFHEEHYDFKHNMKYFSNKR